MENTTPEQKLPIDTTPLAGQKPKNHHFALIGIILVALIALLGFFMAIKPQPSKKTIITRLPSFSPPATSTPPISMPTDLPPLFPQLKWNATQSANLAPLIVNEPIAATVSGKKALSYITRNLSLEKKFRDYYDTQLTSRGWKNDNLIAADGMQGSIWGYSKNNKHFILEVRNQFDVASKSAETPVISQQYSVYWE